MAKKEQWLIDRENRIKAEKDAMAALTPNQIETIIKAHNALRSFVAQWSDGFDLYDADTPRELNTAFWMMQNHFNLDDDDV